MPNDQRRPADNGQKQVANNTRKSGDTEQAASGQQPFTPPAINLS